ncbi:MAG TPA: hypothetical protein VIC63_05375, partial [Candidatus Limnocylindria bacterium]
MTDQHDTPEVRDEPERYGGDGLDFDRDRLTLRFEDPDLEKAFQLDFGSRMLLQHRVGLGLGLGLWITAGFLLVLMYEIDPVAIGLAITVPLAFLIGELAIVDRLETWDSQQVVNGIVNLVGGLSMIFVATRVANVPELLGTV